ncbi:MAG TPA: type II toxin-antitoxin system Phd/YefM family antitoxin [Blastococcus sp.]|jgi:prevent-host-death family protein|nr:type II toxin-antitoxin system Phd/YefM family antitoxin [Blastococcus sp.]
MSGYWQVQEAKQRFSEVVRSARSDGPQFVTKHGDEVAVVLDIREYRRLQGGARNFKDFLRSGPDLDVLDLRRSREVARSVDLDADE